jgi:hypothetical protein
MVDNSQETFQEDSITLRKNQLYGTELINDLRLPRISSPHRKSTPDAMSSNRNQNLASTNQQSKVEARKIVKRSKQKPIPQESKSKVE